MARQYTTMVLDWINVVNNVQPCRCSTNGIQRRSNVVMLSDLANWSQLFHLGPTYCAPNPWLESWALYKHALHKSTGPVVWQLVCRNLTLIVLIWASLFEVYFMMLSRCFQLADGISAVNVDTFVEWLFREPQTIVWLTALHRMNKAKMGKIINIQNM